MQFKFGGTGVDTPTRVIITGDDLGLSLGNNTGILAAHKKGVLTTTCLMMGGEAVADGIAIARQYPQLAVGLHVAFADTKPVLPPEQVPLLVQANGWFPPDDHALKKALLSAQGRQQVRAELTAQFEAYAATGLPWDHVNTHRHVHRNPILATMLYREAARWPVTLTRIPWDPPSDALRTMRAWGLRQIARLYGLVAPDRSIGRDWNVQRVLDLLARLPTGTTELYFHPVPAINHAFAADLPTLLDDRIQEALSRVQLCRGLQQACVK